MSQNTNKVLMVRPCMFTFNEETAVNNHYQINDKTKNSNQIQDLALKEFDNFVKILKEAGIDVCVLQDTKEPYTPDSIFPNNWFSTHNETDDNIVVLYPMFAKNRRLERTEKIYDFIENKNFKIIDLSHYEKEDLFLEGTGSMILDRENKKVYVCLSKRADEKVLEDFCAKLNYKSIVFHAYQSVDGERLPIYHTNVMMGLSSLYSLICLDCIDDINEREKVRNSLIEDGKEIIEISENQVNNFLGNNLELSSKNGDKILIMSESAYRILNEEQKNKIEKYSKIIYSNLQTIEKYGGGSARCMLAEMFI